jgi:hypothetical protein
MIKPCIDEQSVSGFWGGVNQFFSTKICLVAVTVATLALAAVPAIAAEARGEWSPGRDDQTGYGCFASGVYPNGTVLRIGANREVAYAMLTNPGWTNIEPRKEYWVTITFSTDGKPVAVRATGMKDMVVSYTRSETGLVIVSQVGDYLQRWLTAASSGWFSPAVTVHYDYGEHELLHASLAGAQKALQKTVECHERFESADPFAPAKGR